MTHTLSRRALAAATGLLTVMALLLAGPAAPSDAATGADAGADPAAVDATGADATTAPGLVIETLGNRADLLSGGDALVEIRRDDEVPLDEAVVTVDGDRDVSDVFSPTEDGALRGLVTGLDEGDRVVRATAPGVTGAALTLTMHPLGGPIFSGPQIQPWSCNTHGLGEPIDAQCTTATPVQRVWKYRSTSGGTVTFDPANPPAAEEVATLTNSRGQTGPFMYVVETGVMNRGVYRITMFADPTKPFEGRPTNPAWNGGVYYKYGASCGTTYGSGGFLEGVEDNRALQAGYAVATHSLNVLGTNCNTVVSAESSMMVLERLTERVGPIAHVRGKGGSGGSIGQHVVASGYPGLLDGLNVDMSFSDFWTTHKEVADCRLLLRHFTQTSPHLWADARAQALVTGHATTGTCAIWEATFAPLLDPTTGCGAGAAYHPTDNPTGCRATVQDMQVHHFGRRPEARWTDAERAAGFGFAESPYDNTGQLYGLRALQSGDITPEQFVDLNEKIGGLTIDGGFQAERTEADPAVVATAYRAGMIASGETLSEVPIIDIRVPSQNYEFHTNFHSYAMEQRLIDAVGSHDSQSLWKLVEVPNLPSIAGPESFSEMTGWLQAIDDDTAPAATAHERVVRNQPPTAGDSCIVQNQRSQDPTACSWWSHYANPLVASGGPKSNDVLKCALRPLPSEWPADGSFGPVPFTPSVAGVAGQWARLQQAFPDGVCDHRVPGVGQVPVQPWTTFADGPLGRPMGAPPVSRPLAAAG